MAQDIAQHQVIRIRNLEKWYHSGDIAFHALKDINLTVEKGDFLAIVGPSGSGKSTLMNVIGCLDTFDKGEYILNGANVAALNDRELAHLRGKVVGFVFQSFNLLERYTVLENVLLPSLYVSLNNPEKRAAELLGLLGIDDKAQNLPSQISGGQKQRVAIARALMADPEIILADEPTGNLDTKSGQLVIETLEKLNKSGKTIVLITHDMEIAKHARHQVHILDGKIV